MKLTEALSPLFESFKELRTYLEMAEEQGEIAKDVLEDIANAGENIIPYDSSIPLGFLDARNLNDLFRWAMQHPNLPNNLKSQAQTGTVIKMIRTEGVEEALEFLFTMLGGIHTIVSDPARQKPEITKVTSGRGWDAYQLHNYAAAREVCNRYGSNFCIGSSTSSWFDTYGEDRGRDTFAIITNRKPVIVHSGDNGFLVTSSDNNSDINEIGDGRGSKNEAILKDFNDPETAIAAIQSVVPRKFHPNVESIFGDELYNNWLFAVEDVSVVEFKDVRGSGVSFLDMRIFDVFFDSNGSMMIDGLFDTQQASPSQAWEAMKTFLYENKGPSLPLEEAVAISEEIFSKLTAPNMNRDVRVIGTKLLNEVQKEINRKGL